MLAVDNFNCLSVLLHYVYHQINDFEIHTALATILSNIISIVSYNILSICIQESLLISKKLIVLLHKVYSSDPRECLCTQAEDIVKSMQTLVLIQHNFERTL